MAPVLLNPARSDAERKSKRKRRRRRSQVKGQSNMAPPLLTAARRRPAGSAEDAGGAGRVEVEEHGGEFQADHHHHHLQRKCPPPALGQRPLKRKQQLLDGKERPLSCKRAAWAVSQKNALVQLNELRPGLQYQLLARSGPLHAPEFSVGVEVNGLHFEGRGPTKKQAKMRAAELALRSFIQFPNASQAEATLGSLAGRTLDFTADGLNIPQDHPDLPQCGAAKKEVFSSIYNHRGLVRLTLDLVSSANPKAAGGASLLKRLSPVALLNELRPGLSYGCLSEWVHGRPTRTFVMMLRVEGRVFEGCSHSKRQARARAAAAALRVLYNVGPGPERSVTELQGGRAKDQLPQFFAESIFHLVRQKYTELTDRHPSASRCRHKVLAGIVMTRGFDLRTAEVASLATGTRCLDSDAVCDLDCRVSDCHAEVISRRALVRFLYTQLELLLCSPTADTEEQSIFVPNKCSGGFRLRDGVLFHMYVGSSPCGDARLNCPYETAATYPSRRFRCHLRAKVAGGEGTLPATAQRANQRGEGALPGKPLITMSCTDKMAKWCTVGLQGALLSHLLEPVYLHSLTVGTLSHTGHLGRALGRRLAAVRQLPLPHRRQRLLLGCLSSSEGRLAGRAPDVSVNWSCRDEGLEEVSASTGRTRASGAPSRLCRRSLWARWLRLHRQITGTDDITTTYSGSKMAAGSYQRAMQRFAGALQSAGLGTWIRNHISAQEIATANQWKNC